MSISEKPEVIIDDELPVMKVPFFHHKKNEWMYGEALNIDAVDEFSFTYISGSLYGDSKGLRLKLKIGVEENGIQNNNLGNITSFKIDAVAHEKHFTRQHRKMVKKHSRNDCAYTNHLNDLIKIQSFMKDAVDGDHTISSKTSIPVMSGNKGNYLTKKLMHSSFVSLIFFDNIIAGCVVTIGQFSEGYFLNKYDGVAEDGEKPIMVFDSSDFDERTEISA